MMNSKHYSGESMINKKNGLNRRKFLAGTTLIGGALTGCKTDGSLQSSNNSKPIKEVNAKPVTELNPANQGFVPQFLDGHSSASNLVEIGFSMHCGGTREWFRTNGAQLINDIKSGQKRAIFSHVMRSANELNVGVELMRVGEAKYSEAVYSTLALSLHLNRPISSKEVKLFLTESGMEADPSFSEEDAKLALLGVFKVYRDGLGHKQSPIILETFIG
jgi:hypothetical protein